MEIVYSFSATAIAFTDGDASLELGDPAIGMTSTYEFTIALSQPLGPLSRIVVDLPLEVDLP